MKLSKSNLFVLIWGGHLLIYYAAYLSSIVVLYGSYNKLHKVLFGFAIGIYGGLEQIPLFFIIPILLMLLLIKTKLKQNWFMAYSISICFAYLANYLWLYLNNTHDKILFSPKSTNLIYFIIPSLIVAILCNWFIFKKQYKRLGL